MAFVIYGPVLFVSILSYGIAKVLGNRDCHQKCKEMVLWPLGTLSMRWQTIAPGSTTATTTIPDKPNPDDTTAIATNRTATTTTTTTTAAPSSLRRPLSFGMMIWFGMLLFWLIVLYASGGLGYYTEGFYINDYLWIATFARRCVALHGILILMNCMIPIYPMECSFVLARILESRPHYVCIIGLLMTIPFMVIPNGILDAMAAAQTSIPLHIGLVIWIVSSSAYLGYCIYTNRLDRHPLFSKDLDGRNNQNDNAGADPRSNSQPDTEDDDEEVDLEKGHDSFGSSAVSDDTEEGGSDDKRSNRNQDGKKNKHKDQDIFRSAYDEVRDANKNDNSDKDAKKASSKQSKKGKEKKDKPKKQKNAKKKSKRNVLRNYYNRPTEEADESSRASQLDDDCMLLTSSSKAPSSSSSKRDRDTPDRSRSWSPGLPKRLLSKSKSDSSSKEKPRRSSQESIFERSKSFVRNVGTPPRTSIRKRRSNSPTNPYSNELLNDTGHDTVGYFPEAAAGGTSTENDGPDNDDTKSGNTTLINSEAAVHNGKQGPTFDGSFTTLTNFDLQQEREQRDRQLHSPYHNPYSPKQVQPQRGAQSPLQFDPSTLTPAQSSHSSFSSSTPSSSRSGRSVSSRRKPSLGLLPLVPITPTKSGRRAPEWDPFKLISPESSSSRHKSPGRSRNDRTLRAPSQHRQYDGIRHLARSASPQKRRSKRVSANPQQSVDPEQQSPTSPNEMPLSPIPQPSAHREPPASAPNRDRHSLASASSASKSRRKLRSSSKSRSTPKSAPAMPKQSVRPAWDDTSSPNDEQLKKPIKRRSRSFSPDEFADATSETRSRPSSLSALQRDFPNTLPLNDEHDKMPTRKRSSAKSKTSSTSPSSSKSLTSKGSRRRLQNNKQQREEKNKNDDSNSSSVTATTTPSSSPSSSKNRRPSSSRRTQSSSNTSQPSSKKQQQRARSSSRSRKSSRSESPTATAKLRRPKSTRSIERKRTEKKLDDSISTKSRPTNNIGSSPASRRLQPQRSSRRSLVQQQHHQSSSNTSKTSKRKLGVGGSLPSPPGIRLKEEPDG
eukprot:CAMPEP_0119567704 /NCGR_PEP_ID=MMETSP1352-20130426/36714_1 /TAXON_ID=265584 /ORGANISM="Stauroneis constricta, Strain CCMP1120" /LENGTH=1057 /DNA_ID=CAMNT_0007616985 /DNA_START=434 /DNA_END=3603 /DNA_ORIENTATION=+